MPGLDLTSHLGSPSQASFSLSVRWKGGGVASMESLGDKRGMQITNDKLLVQGEALTER